MMLPGFSTALQPISASIADQRAKLAQTRIERHAVHFDADISRDELNIGNFHARAEMGFVAEDGIADVIEMRHLAVVEQQRVFLNSQEFPTTQLSPMMTCSRI